jgi:hypothetical protein
VEQSKQLKNTMLVELSDQNKKLEKVDTSMYKVGDSMWSSWGRLKALLDGSPHYPVVLQTMQSDSLSGIHFLSLSI